MFYNLGARLETLKTGFLAAKLMSIDVIHQINIGKGPSII